MMKKLLAPLVFLVVSLSVFAYDWDKLGTYYPDDTSGVPLLKGDTRDLYIGTDTSIAGGSINIDMKEARKDRRYPKDKNLVTFVEADTWVPGPGKTFEIAIQNMANFGPVAETNTFRIQSKNWSKVSAFFPLTGNEDYVHISLLGRQEKGAKGKMAFYEPSYSIEENLLSDGDGEQMPLTNFGWNSIAGDWSLARKPEVQQGFVPGGTNMIWPGKSPEGVLEQTVSIEKYNEYLKGKNPRAFLGGNIATYSGDHDTAEMVLEGIGSDGSVLESATTGSLDHDIWMFKSVSIKLNPSIKSLRVRLIGKREKGNDNNAYFDNLSLILPGSGPESLYQIRPPMYDQAAESKKVAEETTTLSLKDIAAQLSPLPQIPTKPSKWETTLVAAKTKKFFDNDVAIFAFTYTPTQGESIDVSVEHQLDKILILTERGTFIHKDYEMSENHVKAQLLPNKTYTIFVFNDQDTKMVSEHFVINKVANPNVGNEEEVMTAFYEDPRVYLQKEDFPLGESDYQIAHEFILLNHQVDGKPIRPFRFEAKSGQVVSVTLSPSNLGLTVYDTQFNLIKPTSQKAGTSKFTIPKSGAYWAVVQAPRIKWYRQFSIRIQKSAK